MPKPELCERSSGHISTISPESWTASTATSADCGERLAIFLLTFIVIFSGFKEVVIVCSFVGLNFHLRKRNIANVDEFSSMLQRHMKNSLLLNSKVHILED